MSQTQQPVMPPDKQAYTDLLRSIFFARITRMYLETSLKDQVPEEVTRIHNQTIAKLNDFIAHTGKFIPSERSGTKWLDRRASNAHLYNLSVIEELFTRIGAEEGEHMYEEFMGLIVDLIDSVFYAQKHRKKLYFNKYKALFALIAEEVVRDVNHEPGKVWFRDGQVWLRMSESELPPQIK